VYVDGMKFIDLVNIDVEPKNVWLKHIAAGIVVFLRVFPPQKPETSAS
jgi:hypothetical protein